MTQRNPNLAKLKAGYLFPEIGRRRREFLAQHPDAKIISLGIGDTTEPLVPAVTEALVAAAAAMGTREGYSGYGDERGLPALREGIAARWYDGLVEPDEVFISDGAKPDMGRLQVMFGPGQRMAVQDPAYPVYVDSAVIVGQTGQHDAATGRFDGLIFLPCTVDNGFFPDLAAAGEADVIFFCSPNNPTGAVATHEQLAQLVDHARQTGAIIVFDAAYSRFITDPGLPSTIFAVDGAREVALEVNSFSKAIGFTGVRLGWSVVPKQLRFADGNSVHKDFTRITTTIFNGASNIVQRGALAAFTDPGWQQMGAQVAYYLENAKIIRRALTALGWEVYGGDHAPYIWARVPGRKSWDVFDEILNQAHLVCTPGSGFGPAGEGFVRFSAFGRRSDVEEAVRRLGEMK